MNARAGKIFFVVLKKIDLLNISRIEAGKMKMKLEKISLEDIIIGVIDELKIKAENKGLYLKIEEPTIQRAQGKALPKILIDKEKIRQVILNIIDNAINYTEKGGIIIETEIRNATYEIRITDTGVGMTKEEINKIFDSFSRGSGGNRLVAEGAGLGLYIARKFVELHKGKIWAESPGKSKGSTFCIVLPMMR